MSDGRVSNKGRVVKEDYQKFKKINKNQFIAFSGNKDLCEEIANQIPLQNSKYDLQKIAREIFTVMKLIPFGENNSMSFGIGGIGLNGKIEFFTMRSDWAEIKHYNPDNPKEVDCSLFTSDFIDSEVAHKKMRELNYEFDISTTSGCVKAQKKLNDFVASKDSTVNKNTFKLIIKN